MTKIEDSLIVMVTLPETNILHLKIPPWIPGDSELGNHHSKGRTVSFREGTFFGGIEKLPMYIGSIASHFRHTNPPGLHEIGKKIIAQVVFPYQKNSSLGHPSMEFS